jgi:hypothetical protein
MIVIVVAACAGNAAPPASSVGPTPPGPTPAPSPYSLELANVDGPPVDVLIGGVVVAHLECAGYGRLSEGIGQTPPLPWAITVRRTTGEVLFGPQRFDGGLTMQLLVRGTSVSLTGAPSRGPTSEPCSRWEASATPISGPSGS